jgi:hypothetical protein
MPTSLQEKRTGYKAPPTKPYRKNRLRTFENRVPRGVLGLTGQEVTGNWRKFTMKTFIVFNTNEITSVLKFWKFGLAGHVTRMLRQKCMQNFSWKTSRQDTSVET